MGTSLMRVVHVRSSQPFVARRAFHDLKAIRGATPFSMSRCGDDRKAEEHGGEL